jgi:hypothetical protein
MKRWIVALVAVAFLAGGPALAACKSGKKCGGASKSNCPSQQMSAGACGQAMKAGACGQAMKAGACGQAMKAGACGQSMGGGCGNMMTCASMTACGSRGCRSVHSSQDPTNIWFRGPAPRASMANWACGSGRCGKHGAMRCAGKVGCAGMSSGCCEGASMDCGTKSGCQTSWKAGAGMTCGTGCPHARGRTAWKSGCSANPVTPKGGCCSKRG